MTTISSSLKEAIELELANKNCSEGKPYLQILLNVDEWIVTFTKSIHSAQYKPASIEMWIEIKMNDLDFMVKKIKNFYNVSS